MKTIPFFKWACLLVAFTAMISCSDDNTPGDDTPPPPDGEEYVDGVNTFPESFDAAAQGRIVYKAPQTSPMYGYTGDVYAHIGVLEGSTWMHVPAKWDENITKCKMTKVEDNVWSLELSPDIRTWFGATAGLPIQKIGLVVRSADGTKQTSDLFINVTDASFNPGETVYEAQPAGTVEGINIIDPATVTLVLYDKDLNNSHKDYAYVIGDFNNWVINNDYQMKRDEATGCWWYTLTGLNGQQEYAFQYYVGGADGNIRLADPYTEKVLDPQDRYISSSTYPGLRAYPSDKTADIVSTFITQPQPYTWQVPNFEVKDKNNLVIYEMLFRDFTETGDIQGALGKLSYLKEMGVNAIELMPVQEFDGNDSWGYNPCFFFAMDKAYGSKEMYKQFIDECHRQGIAVILDVVYNHATGANPFAKLYWNASVNKTAANNPWFNVDAPHPYSVFHDFNHESELVRKFVKRNLLFLLEEYNIDGFRFDLTKGFTQKSSTESTASNYDASRIEILTDYNTAIKEAYPDAIVILEHFAEPREEKVLAEAGMKLWSNLNWQYGQTAMGYQNDNSSFAPLYVDPATATFGGWVGYMESHDEERLAYKQTAYSEGALKSNLEVRMKQLEINAAFFFTVPGPKMVWQFGELGYDISITEDDRTGKKPVLWNYQNVPARKKLYETYSTLIDFRFLNPELFSSTVDFNWQVAEANWTNGRFITSKAGNKAMAVVGNFTAAPGNFTINFPSTGTWYNVMDGSELQVTSSAQQIALEGHDYRVYVNFQY